MLEVMCSVKATVSYHLTAVPTSSTEDFTVFQLTVSVFSQQPHFDMHRAADFSKNQYYQLYSITLLSVQHQTGIRQS